MKRSMFAGRVAGLAVLATVLVLAASTAQAAKVLPPQSHAYGKTQAEWSALWWQWIIESPAVTDATGNNTNPNFDTTGAYTLAGQENTKVVFLAGGWEGDITRTITIPTGQPLFFPISNVWSDVLGEDPVPTIPELYARAAYWVDQTVLTDLYATLNGVPLVTAATLPAYRAKSPVFGYDLPADNLFRVWGYDFPAQHVYPAVSDGFWLMLAPLPPGKYTLAFGNVTWLNVTYHITVLPAGQFKK